MKITAKCLSLFIVFFLFFSGCNPSKSVPPKADNLARDFFKALHQRNYGKIKTLLSPRILKPDMEANLETLASFLDKGRPISLEVAGWQVTKFKNEKQTRVTYQYQFKDSWLLASVLIESVSGKQSIMGIQMNPIPKSLQEKNKFTLSGKKAPHYIFLALAVIVPIFILYSLVLCVRIKTKRKWLWIIFILFGIGNLTLNWTTGQISIPSAVKVQLLGVGVLRMGTYAPWKKKTKACGNLTG